MVTFVPGRPLTNVDDVALYPLGKLFIDYSTGKAYRYVEGDGALAGDVLAANQALSWMDDGWEVTNDIDAGCGVAAPAGVAISAIGEGKFGWIQVAGQVTLITDGGVVKGDALVLDSAADGRVDTMAAGEEHEVFAVALANDSSDTAGATVKAILRG